MLTESGKADICDGNAKGGDSVELLIIDICDLKDSSSVEDGVVDACNTSGMWFTILLFQNF